MRRVILNEEAIKEIETFLGEVPMKFASPILQFLIKNLEPELVATTQDPKPIGGGGGGAPIKPKP